MELSGTQKSTFYFFMNLSNIKPRTAPDMCSVIDGLTWILPFPSQPQRWRTEGPGLLQGWWDNRSSNPWTLQWPRWRGQHIEAPCLLEHQYSFCLWWPGYKEPTCRSQLPWKQRHKMVENNTKLEYDVLIIQLQKKIKLKELIIKGIWIIQGQTEVWQCFLEDVFVCVWPLTYAVLFKLIMVASTFP